MAKMPKILFIGTVDDINNYEKDNLEVLGEEGYQVVKAAWGRGNIHSQIKKEKPNLIIIHFGLTYKRRDEAGRELHKIKRETKAKVLVLSASSILFEEADGFIAVPVWPSELLETIKEVLSQK